MDLNFGKRHLQINRFSGPRKKERNNIMNDNKTNINSGIGFAGLLTIVFIVLKLMGIINWSWLWVLSPIWIPWALVIVVAVILAIIAAFKQKERSRK